MLLGPNTPEVVQPWVDRIIANAARVVAEKGLYVEREDVRRQLADVPEATVAGDRVRFTEASFHDFLTQYRALHPFTPPTQFSFGTGAHAHSIVDLEGNLRPITLADIERGARLVGALADWHIGGIAPGAPQDVPAPLRGLAQLIASAKHKPGSAAYATHEPRALPFIRECDAILGQSHGAGIHMVSPLRFEGQEVDEALAARANNPEVSVGIGTMPIIGASTPASVLAAFTTALADIIGGALIMLHTGTPPSRLGMSINAYPFDMRHGCFIYGTPSNAVCTLVERELNRLLGTEIPAKSFSVMVQHPGPQACALKGVFTGMMAAQGRRIFSAVGSLSLDEIHSPVQLIYDREIAGFVMRTEEMLAASLQEEMLLVEDILQTPGDDFMSADSTLRHFRKLQWDSDIFPTRMLAQWQGAGCPMETDAAAAEVRRLLAGYEYELPADQARALDEVYARAEKALP